MAKRIKRTSTHVTQVGSDLEPLTYCSSYQRGDNHELSCRVDSGHRVDEFELVLSPEATKELLNSLAEKLGYNLVKPSDSTLSQAELDCLANGDKLAAVKLLRGRMNLTLMEAKRTIEDDPMFHQTYRRLQ